MNRVERFRGRNPGEAMRKAREALGDEARLLRARRISGWNDPVPAYEVSVTTGATEEESASENLAALRREIEELKQLVSARSVVPDAHGPGEHELDADHEVWIDRLRRRGIPRVRAEQIVREAAAAAPGDVAGAIARTIASDLESHADSRPLGERTTVFVGPSGAGKTTTIAKVAADLAARGKRPVLVTTDGESVAGEDELARVAHALGLPFETAFFSGQLAALAGRKIKDGLLVDTPGRSPFADEGLHGLDEIIGSIPDAEVVLVLAATTDREEARALCLAFRSLGVARVVVTKLDELGRPGRLVELASVLGTPIACITHGRDARGTSSHASDAAVLARVLGSAGAVETRA